MKKKIENFQEIFFSKIGPVCCYDNFEVRNYDKNWLRVDRVITLWNYWNSLMELSIQKMDFGICKYWAKFWLVGYSLVTYWIENCLLFILVWNPYNESRILFLYKLLEGLRGKIKFFLKKYCIVSIQIIRINLSTYADLYFRRKS